MEKKNEIKKVEGLTADVKQKTKLEYDRTGQPTNELIDLKDELMNVNLNKLKVPNPRIHSDWKSVFESTRQRVAESLGPEFKLSLDYSDFAFYIFSSMNLDLLSFVLIFNMTMYLVDDHLDKFPSEYVEITQQLRKKNFPGNRVYEKWINLFLNVYKEVMSEKELNQLIDFTISWISHSMVRLCSDQPTMSDSDYLRLRAIDCGSQHQFYFILLNAGKELTDELKNDPDYINLNYHVASHVGLVNDLYSLRKEIRDNVHKCNYVFIKMNNWNISAQDSVDEIIAEIEEVERMARVYGERLRDRNDVNLSKYVDGTYDVMAGNHYWSTYCKRYNGGFKKFHLPTEQNLNI